MKEQLKRRAREFLSQRGLALVPEFAADLSPEMIATITAVRPHTMTTVARIQAVIAATEHVVRHSIPGAFVESGVWLGGSSMAAARTLVEMGDTTRDLYLYDTFEGIPAPGEHDGLIGSDVDIHGLWRTSNDGAAAPWLDAPVETVRENMLSTGYPDDRLHLIPGLVEDTIPATAPEQIAFLRLDTDWYESTKLEMETLFPRLSPGGIVIIDDYGFTEGARRAVDEFLATYPDPVFLQRIDSCGRMAVKPGTTS